MNVAKHVARSSLLIEHLSPTNSRVSYSSLHGFRISIAAAAAAVKRLMATNGDGDAVGGGEIAAGADGYVGSIVLHVEITHLADENPGARASDRASRTYILTSRKTP